MTVLRAAFSVSGPVVLSAILAWAGTTTAAPASAAVAPALPDTGVFAPVARQYKARLARLKAIGTTRVTPERLRLLLATGQPDAAAALLPKLAGPAREVAVTKARVLLARQRFDEAQPILEGIAAIASPTAAERELAYAWLSVRDDVATVDTLSRRRIAEPTPHARDLLAAARVALDLLDYPRAESLYTRALAARDSAEDREGGLLSSGHTGIAFVLQKRRQWDASLARLEQALRARATPEVLIALTETLIRLGRTDDAIRAGEWAVKLNPYHESSHYLLGNGYARRNYTQLAAAYRGAFADSSGRRFLDRADSLLAAGRRVDARSAYARIVRAHPGWADARVRLASLDFEDGRFAESRDHAFAALAICPEYGRAHAVLAKALEGQRFAVDVHRPGYEQRFAAAATPEVPGIETFVVNWRSLSPRHQKRVALSVAPWRAFIPVLVEGGATFYIKPLYMLLSETPGGRSLRDQRINYDSRLWDDVRGAGGYHTVTGVEDVERTIFDRYNTVLHELSHQVHAVLPADDSRAIQELYRKTKERDDVTKDAYLSRYAGGSVYEYFAEGANALESPKRDAWDPREVVKERLDRMDPALEALVKSLFARTDVSDSYPIAYAAGGDDRVSLGQVEEALPLYLKALARKPDDESVLVSYANALLLGNRAAQAESIATRAVAAHPASGPARNALADAQWHAGRGLATARAGLAAARGDVRAEDRWQVDATLGYYAWVAGDAAGAGAAFDSVLAYQSDSPQGLSGHAAALALAGRWAEAVPAYEAAVRMRTGVVDLRNDYARDLLRASRVADARAQLDAARLLDEHNPTAEALRGWAELVAGHREAAHQHAMTALSWGAWNDLAWIVLGAAERADGNAARAEKAWEPLKLRMAWNSPPEYVYRPEISTWERVHILPWVERTMLETLQRP